MILEPSSPDYKRWRDLVLLTLRRYTLDDHVLSDVTDLSVYWARLDNIVVDGDRTLGVAHDQGSVPRQQRVACYTTQR
jgi:hypothetical protein